MTINVTNLSPSHATLHPRTTQNYKTTFDYNKMFTITPYLTLLLHVLPHTFGSKIFFYVLWLQFNSTPRCGATCGLAVCSCVVESLGTNTKWNVRKCSAGCRTVSVHLVFWCNVCVCACVCVCDWPGTDNTQHLLKFMLFIYLFLNYVIS